MAENRATIRLTPALIELESFEFKTICSWPFSDPFVRRLLRDDIPHRVQFGHCRVWIYRDPLGQLVGFGAFDLCDDYAPVAGNMSHPYIPLLGVNPTIKSLAYGTAIMGHLMSEAAVLCRTSGCADTVFLEVYTTSARAISLYARCGFQQVTGEILDEAEGRHYFVMAKRVSLDMTSHS
jgi:ribosomal protein S18 acetylase RimI-like enzyme